VSEDRRLVKYSEGIALESKLSVCQLAHNMEAPQVLANRELSEAVDRASQGLANTKATLEGTEASVQLIKAVCSVDSE
jgi:hypothetical protein